MIEASKSARQKWRIEADALMRRLIMVGSRFANWQPAEDASPEEAREYFVRYHPIEQEFWALMREANLGTEPENWKDWKKARRDFLSELPEAIGKARIHTLAAYLTALQQEEHVNEGTIAKAFEDGCMQAVLERLLELSHHLPYDPVWKRWAYEITDHDQAI